MILEWAAYSSTHLLTIGRGGMRTPNYRTIIACRSCGSANLETVLNLGELYISDFILPGEPEDLAPLELIICKDCSLAQLRHTVDRDRLYRDNYRYQSGINESMVAALRDVVDYARSKVELQPYDKVLDIGCNDGTLLSFYPSFVDTYGYEPAWNLWEKAKKKSRGCIYPTYFPRPTMIKDKYKIITSIAQFYNVDDLNAYVAEIKKSLAPGGVWIVQMQDLEGMLDCNGLDNLCHEHLTYFSLASFLNLICKYSLIVESMQYNSINGRSVRLAVRHDDLELGLLHDFAKPSIEQQEKLRRFSSEAWTNMIVTLNCLKQFRVAGKVVLGVAASTKANTLLQYYHITPELLPAIAERSPEKIGRVTVGTHIPIISEKELCERKPDILMPLAWHFLNSFKKRYSWFRGQWFVPLPIPHLEDSSGFLGVGEPIVLEDSHVTGIQQTESQTDARQAIY